MEIDYISAEPGHASLLSALQEQIFPGEQPWTAGSIAVLLENPACTGFVIARTESGGNEEPLGFVLVQIVQDEAEILSFGILPSWRGQGVGGQALRKLKSTLELRNVRYIYLEVAEDNPAAIRTYRSQGFVVTGSRPAYYKRVTGEAVTALLLRCDLNQKTN